MDNNNKLNIAITESLRNEIENSGKTKAEIARAIGVTSATVSQYLSGRVLPSLATLSRLCNFIDCSADEILQIKLK